MKQAWRIEKNRMSSGMPYYLISPAADRRHPLVICMHGLTANKESFLPIGLEIAGHGYAVALPDARNHGERKPKDFDARMSDNFGLFFMDCVTGTADEIPGLIDEVQSRPDVASGEAAMIGFSMGGYITYRACCLDKRIAVAAPVAASGSWSYIPSPQASGSDDPRLKEQLAAVDPAQKVRDFPPRAILMQHGLLDEHVPVELSKKFYELARPYYRYSPDRLQWVEYPNLGHEFNPEIQARCVEWILRWLPPAG